MLRLLFLHPLLLLVLTELGLWTSDSSRKLCSVAWLLLLLLSSFPFNVAQQHLTTNPAHWALRAPTNKCPVTVTVTMTHTPAAAGPRRGHLDKTERQRLINGRLCLDGGLRPCRVPHDVISSLHVPLAGLPQGQWVLTTNGNPLHQWDGAPTGAQCFVCGGRTQSLLTQE